MTAPVSKKDFQEVINNLKTFQDEAAEKRRKEDQIKYNEDQKRLMEIGKELKQANATDTLKLEAEKDKINQERSTEKLKQESGKRNIEIQKSALELQKAQIEATGGIASDNLEYRNAERKLKLDELAERKRTATGRAAQEEIAKEERELLGNYFERFLGKDSRLASGLTSIGEGLKAKVQGGLEGLFNAIKTGAFVAFLFGLQKFLRSDLFKKITDTVIPFLADGLEKIVKSFKALGESFKNIGQTIDNIKAGFTDEDGNITFVAGVKNAIKEISDLFEGTGTALATIGTLSLFAFRKQLIGLALGVGARLLSISGLTSIFSDNLGTVDSDMKKRNKLSKGSTGVFGSGLRSIGSRFGKLFLRLGAFGALIGGASLLMSDKVEASGKTGGVFDKVKTSFKSLFGAVKDFGSKVTNSAFKMGQNVIDAGKTGVFSIANGIETGFTKLFTKVGDFGAKVATTVSGMGKAITDSTVFSTVSAKFSGFFGKVGDFGTKVADRAKILGESVTSSSVFKALSTTFDSLFGVVTNFGKEIAKVASAAAGATADAVKAALKSVASIGAEPAKTKIKISTEVDSSLRRAQENITKTSIGTPQTKGGASRRELIEKVRVAGRPTPNLIKAQTTSPNLGGSGAGGASPKVSAADAPTIKTDVLPRLATLDTVLPKVPMVDLTSLTTPPNKPKISTGTEVSKKLKKSVAKNTSKLLLKTVVVVGAVTSGYFALKKLIKGDYVGAAMEGADIFAPSLVGLPLSVATAARDTYNDTYATDSNKFPFDKDLANHPAQTNERLGLIVEQIQEKLGASQQSSRGRNVVRIAPAGRYQAPTTLQFQSGPPGASGVMSIPSNQTTAQRLIANPAYDRNSDGVISSSEGQSARRGKMRDGPLMIAAPSVVNNSSSSSTVVMSKSIVDTSAGGYFSDIGSR